MLGSAATQQQQQHAYLYIQRVAWKCSNPATAATCLPVHIVCYLEVQQPSNSSNMPTCTHCVLLGSAATQQQQQHAYLYIQRVAWKCSNPATAATCLPVHIACCLHMQQPRYSSNMTICKHCMLLGHAATKQQQQHGYLYTLHVAWTRSNQATAATWLPVTVLCRAVQFELLFTFS